MVPGCLLLRYGVVVLDCKGRLQLPNRVSMADDRSRQPQTRQQSQKPISWGRGEAAATTPAQQFRRPTAGRRHRGRLCTQPSEQSQLVLICTTGCMSVHVPLTRFTMSAAVQLQEESSTVQIMQAALGQHLHNLQCGIMPPENVHWSTAVCIIVGPSRLACTVALCRHHLLLVRFQSRFRQPLAPNTWSPAMSASWTTPPKCVHV
ncbi:hypothetical protein T440DRAFT_211027 [Plenodomus tracheiphilus IPT5]|uniref:Uncharacterized protein n=1 Tax=Plenodomus tracheiphilus IPT5 TaxID=1408161 RepID=A0A6A7AYN7_9PLEO|nr:hypothetical protein T440DRAFT_211027 [Plenodomus tracheiphilus IPT5]